MSYSNRLDDAASIGTLKINSTGEVIYIDDSAKNTLGIKDFSSNYIEIGTLTQHQKQLKFQLPVSYHAQDQMQKNGTTYCFDDIIGENTELKKTVAIAKKIANNSSSILILGDTGTGKELFAQSIHNESKFANGPFIAINCAAIPETLVESVLFGTVKGSFTGASDNPGLLAQAHNGTIFLDEVNSMNLDAQAKLLRFLESKTIRSVGDHKQRKINCRVIGAVNQGIESELKSGNLRPDLYYRLSAVTIFIPPLSERKDDIPILCDYFIAKYASRFGLQIKTISNSLLNLLFNYSWPGNVRELEHLIESALNMANPGELTLDIIHLTPYLLDKLNHYAAHDNRTEEKQPLILAGRPLIDILEEIERRAIIERLIHFSGNISQTANDLGIFRQALQYRIKKYGISEAEYSKEK